MSPIICVFFGKLEKWRKIITLSAYDGECPHFVTQLYVLQFSLHLLPIWWHCRCVKLRHTGGALVSIDFGLCSEPVHRWQSLPMNSLLKLHICCGNKENNTQRRTWRIILNYENMILLFKRPQKFQQRTGNVFSMDQNQLFDNFYIV